MKKLCWLLSVVGLISALLSSKAFAAEEQASGEAGNTEEFVTDVLTPFWNARQVQDSMLFLELEEGKRPTSRLLFKPDQILSVKSGTREMVFEEGRDYIVGDEIVTLPEGSRIPFLTLNQLYPLMTSDRPKIARQAGDKTRGVFFENGYLYHQMQVEVTYKTTPGQWTGYVPQYAGDALPKTMEKLRNKQPIKLVLNGDSISAGLNASKVTGAMPGCPDYGELVGLAMQKKFGSKVEFKNYAVGGWNAARGLQRIHDENLAAEKPDLVIIAYGMNDVFAKDAATYKANIAAMIEAIRKESPDAEFILVATMLGNAEWGMPMEQFPLHRDALKELCGPGVVLADLTTMWGDLLKEKGFYDLVGNGVNHPNDFGHRIYAQTILALLTEPTPEVNRAAASEKKSLSHLLQGAPRILFLGDSITAAGEYVAYFDAWLTSRKEPQPPIVLDMGLASETVSGLSEDGHAGGAFPRPKLSERLDRVLALAKPNVVVACYGMNCGIYMPADESRFQKYREGILALRSKVEAAGAKLVLVTPPYFDEQQANYAPGYNKVLGRYADWLVQQGKEQGWDVIDLHRAMTQGVEKRRQTQQSFTFQPDGVHPDSAGHWFMAQQIITAFGGDAASAAVSPEEMISNADMPADVLELVKQRMLLLRDAYVATAGHKRPGVAPGLPIAEAESKARELSSKIIELTDGT